MFFIRLIRKLTFAAVLVCYAALAILIIYFPLGFLGEIIIYPLWRWSFLVDRMDIKDSIFQFFLLSLVGAFFQVIDSSLARRIPGNISEKEDGAETAEIEP